MSLNLIMIDHASKDKQSVKAMLQGVDDGRERLWGAFKKVYPSLPMESLMEKFEKEARYGRIGTTFTQHLATFISLTS